MATTTTERSLHPATGTELLAGRERELAQLEAALHHAGDGHGGAVAIVGAEGIGKSALARRVSADAGSEGWSVAWGRGGLHASGLPYWPWIEVLDGLDPACARWLQGGRPAVAVAGAGDLVASVPGPTALPAPAGSERLALFRRVAEAITRGSSRRRVLLVLDDLHLADEASLLLARYLAGQIAAVPVLLLCIWRAASDRLLGEGVVTVGLAGLPEQATAQLLQHHLGHPLALAQARRIHAATDGHPLYVEEVARLLAARRAAGVAEQAGAVPIPATLQLTLRSHLESLDVAARSVLQAAAVVGREFDPALVAAVARLPAPAVQAGLEAAQAAGLIEPGPEPQRRFRHELLRQALLEGLPGPERAELHRRAAAAIEDAAAPGGDGGVAALAHHLRAAVPAVSPAVAGERTLRAAGEAMAALAYEQAAELAAQALELDLAADLRARLGLLLGRARQAAGEVAAARVAVLAAARQARAVEAYELLAEAALVLGATRSPWAAPGPDRELLALLREALRQPLSSPWPALLAARLAEEQVAARDFAQADALSRQALAAVAHGDAATMFRALRARLLAGLSQGPEERAVLVRRTFEAAQAAGDPAAELEASLWAVNDGVERADRAAVDRAAQRLDQLATALSQPHLLWSASVCAAMLALMEGRLQDAQRLADTARREGHEVVPLVEAAYATQLIVLRREQGRLAEIEPLMRAGLERAPQSLTWRVSWLALLVALGQLSEAQRELERLPRSAWKLDPTDYEWPARLTLLAEICTGLEDAERAAEVRRALEPHAGQVMVVSFSVLCRGAVDRYLGLLAGTCGEVAAAEAHFDRAQALHGALDAHLWTARTETDRARVRARVGDLHGAKGAARNALSIAEALGLESLVAEAGAILSHQPRADTSAVPEEMVFRREGEVWAIGNPEAPVRLPDRRGLGYIAALVAAPGSEHAALELAGAVVATEQPVLDGKAKAALRARLEELRDQIARAERLGMAQDAALARSEFDELVAEAGRALGLRGHDRRLSGPAERARSSVTKAIRSAIERIAELDPSLAQHLDRAIRTGAFCRYVPDERHPISWRVTM